MQPKFHPAPDELLDYATGAAPEWMSLMVACHLTLCPSCRRDSELLDALGGALLETHNGAGTDRLRSARPDPATGLEQGLAEALSRLSDPSPPEPSPPVPRAAAGAGSGLAGVVPRPVHRYFAERQPRWRWLAPGITHVPLRVDDAQVRLIRLRRGFVIPEHGHAGLEWVLVLDGELGDSSTGERYGRGDLCRSESDKIHYQDVAPDESCIALVANLGPLVPRTLLGRILAKVVGI